jgi:type I restriction enzyme S subunit
MSSSAPTIPKIKISEDWESYRLKRLAKIRYGLGQPPREKDGGIPIIRATNIERGKINRKDLTHVDPEDVPWDRNPLLKRDDIIVVRSGAYTGDSAIIPKDYEGSIAGYDMVVSPVSIEPRYLAFALLSNFVLFDQIYLFRIRSAQPHLNAEELGDILVPFPSRREQTAIATFLDRKTAQIDRAIAIKEKQIALLRERKQILIQNAVTRGLDPDVPMRDSGVEWIGEIPGHWEIKRLKYVLEERKERSRSGEEPLLMVSQTHGLVVRSEFHEKAEIAENNIGNKIVYKN